jgi:lipopolysaccharide export system permease protein
MKILDRYIRKHLVEAFVVVLLVLVSIFSFLDFVEELDDIALGNYGAFDAILFIIMTVPERALWLVPVSALLGSLIGLSMLDHHNELAVIRAAGVSARRISWSVLKTTGLLLVVVIVFAQFISPALGKRAWRVRALAIAGDVVLRKDSGTSFWFRDGQRFISIRDMVYGRIPTEIEIYEFNEQGELAMFTEAREAQSDSHGAWLLKDVVRKRFDGFEIELERLPTLRWRGFLSPDQGAVIELDAESLAPSDLYYYARDLRARGQNADRYELTLWRKLNVPFTTLAMVLIAIPFVFGPHGRGGIGGRVLLGAGIGILFYMIDQVLAQVALLAKFSPALTATAPAAVLFLVALIMLRRVR